MKFFQKRTVCLCSDEVVDHVDGGGKQHLDVGITSGISDRFCEEGFSGAGVADQDHILMLLDKV